MTGEKTIDVVTIGESMVLLQPMTEGPLKYSPLFTRSIAGAESNVALGLTRLGKKVRWISRLGIDPFGEMIESTLAGEGVDTSCVLKDPEAPTAIYFKEFKGYGDPNVFYYRRGSAASRLAPRDIQPEWFDGARHLHVTGITPALGEQTADAVRTAMKTARERGLTVSFDPNLRRKLWKEETARSVLLSLIPLCDVFLPGLEEAEFLLGPKTEEQYGDHFLNMGPGVIALKLGERGSVGFAEGLRCRAEPYKVSKIVDTVGAGDAFATGFLSVLLDREQPLEPSGLSKTLPEALLRANIMGALATQYKGDWEGLPTLSEIERIQSGKQGITR
ncbi:sugar kinase [Ferviditalea candida]|uniref:Sugar kinase n=1 Tax=Ferviditalea candida TaxID=3108399 RepID=A0ABU5ZH10_9BACL|nr:sugar kinase [Paenibacillaceae bacterium T2]